MTSLAFWIWCLSSGLLIGFFTAEIRLSWPFVILVSIVHMSGNFLIGAAVLP